MADNNRPLFKNRSPPKPVPKTPSFYKTEALEQVPAIAKAAQNPQDGILKKLANTSIKYQSDQRHDRQS